jgi:hypothetical protein
MRPIMILAALALIASAPPSFAQKIDKNGRCHDASGKFAKAEVCNGVSGAATSATKSANKSVKSAAAGAESATAGAATAATGAAKSATKPAAAADANAPYKLDAKGKCHDVHGKMAAKAKCA